MGADTRAQSLLVTGTVAGNDLVEFVPVYFTEIILSARFIPLQVRVRKRQAQIFGLGNRLIHKFLAQFIITVALDLPLHGLGGMGGIRVTGTEHHQRRPPPPVYRILRHRFLLHGSLTEHHQQFKALAHVKTLFLANPHHGPGIRAVRATAQGDLVDDGG